MNISNGGRNMPPVGDSGRTMAGRGSQSSPIRHGKVATSPLPQCNHRMTPLKKGLGYMDACTLFQFGLSPHELAWKLCGNLVLKVNILGK